LISLCGGKINVEIPFILGNTDISLKIREAFPVILGNTYISLKIGEAFPVILSKSLDFVLFLAVNRNFFAYFGILSLHYGH
jgi:hypothetical protein